MSTPTLRAVSLIYAGCWLFGLIVVAPFLVLGLFVYAVGSLAHRLGRALLDGGGWLLDCLDCGAHALENNHDSGLSL